MGDYAVQTWVDDTGDGASGTVYTKARMDYIEAGIKDAAEHNRIGTFATMPVAAAANKGWLWIATDTDGTGGLYRSDGAAWVKMPLGSLLSNNTRFGLGGLLSSVNADRAAFYANYTATTDRLIDTSKPGWALFIGAASDTFTVYRAAPTTGSPSFTSVLSLSSGGVLSSPATTLSGDLSGALPAPIVAILSAANLRFGVAGGLRSNAAGFSKLYSNFDPVAGTQLDATMPSWQLSLDGRAATDEIQIFRSPAGSTVFALVLQISPSRIVFPGQLRVGTNGSYANLAADAGGLGLAGNTDPVTGFQLDGAKPSWRVLNFYAGGTNDFWKVQRGAPTGNTTTAPTWTDFIAVDSGGSMRLGSGGGAALRGTGFATAAMFANYVPVTDRLNNTTLPGWLIQSDSVNDRVLISRAAPTTGSPVWVPLLHLQNDGSMIGGNPPWVTVLPTTGPNGGALQDGQEVNYLADAATGTVWRLKYRAAEAGAFKWYFVGGQGLESVVDTTQSTSSVAYTDLTTVGPSITVPLAGDYDMEMSALCGGTGGANRCFVTPKKNAAATADADGSETSVAGGSTNTGNAYRRKKLLNLAANDVFKLQYAVLNATAVGFGFRALKMTPIRVG